MFFFFLTQVVHFLSVTRKKTEPKERVRKRPELGGRMSDYRNHSMNSLRSNSISCRFACLAYATQESKKIPIIVHPLKTSSCGMFSKKTWSTKCGNRLCRFACRSAPAMLAWLVQECFRGALRRQAFSVVGVRKTWRTRSVSGGQRLESHTKSLMEGGLCPESTTSSPYRGEAWWGWMLLSSRRRKKERKKLALYKI